MNLFVKYEMNALTDEWTRHPFGEKRQYVICEQVREALNELKHIDDVSVSFIPNFFLKTISECNVWCYGRLSLHSHFFTMLLLSRNELEKTFLMKSPFLPRPFSGRSQSLSSSRPAIPAPPKANTPYEIPHFDFDQPEIVEGPPDVDEVNIWKTKQNKQTRHQPNSHKIYLQKWCLPLYNFLIQFFALIFGWNYCIRYTLNLFIISYLNLKNDVLQVLEEIRQKDVVEETISPVFCIQLVLNVPGAEKPREERKRHRRHKTSSPDKSGYFSLGKSDSASTRKTVQFQDMEEASGHFIGHVTGFLHRL